MIKTTDIHYIAGLLEGEGSFGFYKCPVIQVHMTDSEPIHKLNMIMCPAARVRVQTKLARKTMYVFHFSGQLAIEWMMTIYPLMSSRRKEIINQWKLVTGRHHVLSQHNRTRRFTSKSSMYRH